MDSTVDEVANCIISMKENNLEKESRNAFLPGVCASNRKCNKKNDVELKGEFIKTELTKSTRGLGFTIVSADGSSVELLQIKTIVPSGPAYFDGCLQTGDVLVYVDSQSVFGFTHSDIINLFQSIPVGSKVTLEVCRGYSLPFDPNDPSTEVITTVAVTHPAAPCHTVFEANARSSPHSIILPNPLPNHSFSSSQRITFDQRMSPLEQVPATRIDRKVIDEDAVSPWSTELATVVVKGADGFGFTIANSFFGQKIKQVIDSGRCKNLLEGDILTEINGRNIKNLTHSEVVEILKNCPRDEEAVLKVYRGGHTSRRRQQSSRSRSQKQETASVDNAASVETNSENVKTFNLDSFECCSQTVKLNSISKLNKSVVKKELNCSAVEQNEQDEVVIKDSAAFESALMTNKCVSGTPDYTLASSYRNPLEKRNKLISVCQSPMANRRQLCNHVDHCCHHFDDRDLVAKNLSLVKNSGCFICEAGHHFNRLQLKPLKRDFHMRDSLSQATFSTAPVGSSLLLRDGIRMAVRLDRGEVGFGIRIIGGIEEGSQVAVGYIVPDGAAEVDGHLEVGDEIIAINQQSVIGASHHEVVSLMSQSAQLGFVILDVLKHGNPLHQIELPNLPLNVFDVVLTRKEDEGFGFVIISSVTKAVSIVGKIIEGSPAGGYEGLHVGDNILAVNGVNIGSMPHQEIVNLIKASGLSIALTVSPVNAVESRHAITPKLDYPKTSDDFHLIALRRGSRGFGFSIRGGQEFDGMSLYILKIADESPAKLDGRLQVGDQVIEINGCNTLGLMHSEAIDLLQNSRASLSLLVKRSSCVFHEQIHGVYSLNSDEVSTENCEKMITSKKSSK